MRYVLTPKKNHFALFLATHIAPVYCSTLKTTFFKSAALYFNILLISWKQMDSSLKISKSFRGQLKRLCVAASQKFPPARSFVRHISRWRVEISEFSSDNHWEITFQMGFALYSPFFTAVVSEGRILIGSDIQCWQSTRTIEPWHRALWSLTLKNFT